MHRVLDKKTLVVPIFGAKECTRMQEFVLKMYKKSGGRDPRTLAAEVETFVRTHTRAHRPDAGDHPLILVWLRPCVGGLEFRPIIRFRIVYWSSIRSFRRNFAEFRFFPVLLLCPRPHRAETLSDDARLTSGICLSDVERLSVAYIGPKSKTERRRKTKIGKEVAHFQGQKVKGQLAGGGVYCGSLPHSLLLQNRNTYWAECSNRTFGPKF